MKGTSSPRRTCFSDWQQVLSSAYVHNSKDSMLRPAFSGDSSLDIDAVWKQHAPVFEQKLEQERQLFVQVYSRPSFNRELGLVNAK
jgi:hypothetical protein